MLDINATLGFPGNPVLTQFVWSVGPGEGVVLTGPNGSGKTTLMRSAAGLLAPRSGSVLIGGMSATHGSAKKSVGYLPDPPALYEELSPWEHLDFVRRLWAGSVTQSMAEDAASALHLMSYLHQRCDTLSLGMRKRVGIALATMHRPTLLLFDEPFNGLDRASEGRLRKLLSEHVSASGSFVVSTHQPRLLQDVATRVSAVLNGALVYDGPSGGWNPGPSARDTEMGWS
jgi:ABC-type multidrug transport system ATPase subunit